MTEVIRVTEEAHAAATAYCKRHELAVKCWLSGLIQKEIDANTPIRPVEPMKLETLPTGETDANERGPFWATLGAIAERLPSGEEDPP